MPVIHSLFQPRSGSSRPISRKHIKWAKVPLNPWCITITNFSKSQDTWHVDQHLFDEEQAQALATMVSGTSYCALTIPPVCPGYRSLTIFLQTRKHWDALLCRSGLLLGK